MLTDECESAKNWPPEEPLLLEAYAFGDVLRGADPLDCVEIVLVLNLPPQEVVWGSTPHGTAWLADRPGTPSAFVKAVTRPSCTRVRPAGQLPTHMSPALDSITG